MLQGTYLHVCAIGNVCVDLVVVVVIVIVVPKKTLHNLQIKLYFPVVVIVVDVVCHIDNGVDGRNNETKETK